MIGEWKSWHNNGQLILFANYKVVDESLLNILSSTNSGQIFMLRYGPYKSWYENGNPQASGMYKDDLMDGEWNWFYENGQPSTIEKYTAGQLTQMKCFDSTGKETGDFCSISKPAMLKDFGNYREYIESNLLWPEEAAKKKIQGLVKVKFKVNKKGELKDLTIESAQPILKKAVEELFLNMKEWYPAVSHNRTVDFEDEMEIPFYLKKKN